MKSMAKYINLILSLLDPVVADRHSVKKTEYIEVDGYIVGKIVSTK